MTTVTTLISDYYSGVQRAQFLGLQATFMGFGGVVFIMLAGLLADLNWHAPFLVYALALAIFPLALRAIHEPLRTRVAPPPTRAAPPPTRAEPPPTRAEPLPMLSIALIYGIIMLAMIALYLAPVQLPYFLEALGSSGTETAIAISAITFFAAWSSLLFRWLSVRLDVPSILALGLLLFGIGFVILAGANSYAQVFIGLMISGFGLGQSNPVLILWLSRIAPETARGRLMGGLTMALFLGQFLSPLVSAPVIAASSLNTMFALAGAALLGLAALVIVAGRFAVRGRSSTLAVPASTGD